MSALIDTTTGRAAIAYTNEVPWHGLGTRIDGNQTLEEWRKAAGLDWTAKESVVRFDSDTGSRPFAEKKVLYRSDTQAPLSVVSGRYQPVQPEQVVNFYEDLCERYGYAMETMGALRDGKTIWALAKAGLATKLAGIDAMDAYVLLYTSYDSTCATTAKFTNVRVVCNNTLTMAQSDKAGKASTVRHSSTFDADKVKLDLGIGDAWARHVERLGAMADTKVSPEQQVQFLLKVYHDLTVQDDDAKSKPVERTMQRLAGILAEAPGAQLVTARDTVFGLLNAVTYDVDHSTRARTDDSRLVSAWMGSGEARKNKAFDAALALID